MTLMSISMDLVQQIGLVIEIIEIHLDSMFSQLSKCQNQITLAAGQNSTSPLVVTSEI